MNTVFIFSGVPYDFLRQRPHHMALFFEKKGYRVVYLSITDRVCIEHLQKINDENTLFNVLFSENKDNIYILNKRLIEYKSIERNLEQLTNKISEVFDHINIAYIFAFPAWIKYFQKFPSNCKIIYDCMDDWESFISNIKMGYDEALLYDERKLASIADLVTVSAKRLYTKMSYFNSNIYYLPNGVWNKDYSDLENDEVPEDIYATEKPIIFFMGSVSEWVDINLIEYIANARPNYSFVFVGHERVDLPSSPNIYFLGQKRYEELPNYLKQSKVAIIPFKENNLTASVTPLKLYEYLSSGTPVVSTIMPDILGLPGLKVSIDYEDFLNYIDHYIQMNEIEYDEECRKALRTANNFDWSKLLEPLRQFIEGDFQLEPTTNFIVQTTQELTNYKQNNMIRNELLGLYMAVGQYQNAIELFTFDEVKSANHHLDYEKLALAYILQGKSTQAISLLRIYFSSDDKKLFLTYLNSLLVEKNKDELLKVFLLKLSGDIYKALNIADSLVDKDQRNLKVLGILSALYLDIGEYDNAFQIAVDVINKNEEYRIEELFDFYMIKFVIKSLLKHKQYNLAEQIVLFLMKIDKDWEKKAVELLSDIYIEKYMG